MKHSKATVNNAIVIAATAHDGQFDKAGAPYILHPLRLMMKMQTEEAMMVAVLHDVVEDSREKDEDERWTFEKLRDRGFSDEVLEALECVTDREGETYDEFIKRAASNPIARPVKIADLEDNMNMLRMNEIRPKDLERLEKYHRAWKHLKRSELV